MQVFRSGFGYAGFSLLDLTLEDFWEVYFVCSIKIDLSNFPIIFFVLKQFERFWICMFFRSESDFGGLLKYNALKDFQELLT